jgi:hypothetical protein
MKASKKSIKEVNKLTSSEMNEVKGRTNYIKLLVIGEFFYIEVA